MISDFDRTFRSETDLGNFAPHDNVIITWTIFVN